MMKKQTFVALLWAMACLMLPATVKAQSSVLTTYQNADKIFSYDASGNLNKMDRQYWLGKNTDTNYQTAVDNAKNGDLSGLQTITADVEHVPGAGYGQFQAMIGQMGTLSVEHVQFTIVAKEAAPIPYRGQQISGYAVLGEHDAKYYDAAGYYKSATAFTAAFNRLPTVAGYPWPQPDKNPARCFSVPMFLKCTAGDNSGKTFLIVGLDFGALRDINYASNQTAEDTPIKFILPSSITYVGNSSLANCGSSDEPVMFHDVAATTANNIYDGNADGVTFASDPTTSTWQSYNNITAIEDYSFFQSKWKSTSDIFVAGKLRSLGSEGLKITLTETSNGNQVKNGCFFDCQIREVDFSSFTHLEDDYVPHGAFFRCGYLSSVKLGDVKEIHAKAFANCTKLTNVELPQQLKTIGDSAFYCFSTGYTSTLATVTFPGGRATATLDSIGIGAFNKCEKLTRFSMPPTVRAIGSRAFYYCLKLTGRYDIPPALEYIGDEAYQLSGISHIVFPKEAGKDKQLTMGRDVFGRNSTSRAAYDLLVEFESPIPQKIIATASPFYTKPYDETKVQPTVRLLVPVGSGELYMHANKYIPNFVGSLYSHHDYRVMFDLSSTYKLPPYGTGKKNDDGTYTYDESPWRVFSASWANDVYTLMPSNGGSVDKLTETSAATYCFGDAGETQDTYTAAPMTRFASVNDTVGAKFGTAPSSYSTEAAKTTQLKKGYLVKGLRAHKYHANDGLWDNIPRLSTVEVKDGIFPPDEGLLLAVHKDHPSKYLVPLYGDLSFVEGAVTGLTTPKNEINRLGGGHQKDASTSRNRGFIYINSASSGNWTEDETKALLTGLPDKADQAKYWLDILEQHNELIRDLYVYDGSSNTTSSITDIQGYKKEKCVVMPNEDGEYEVFSYVEGEKDNYIGNSLGLLNAKTTDDSNKDKFVFLYSTNTGYDDLLCNVYFRYYAVPSEARDVKWWIGKKEEGNAALYAALEYKGDFAVNYSTNVTTLRNQFAAIEGSEVPYYWVNIFALNEDYDENNLYRKDFYDQHKDKDNILVPRIMNLKDLDNLTIVTGYEGDNEQTQTFSAYVGTNANDGYANQAANFADWYTKEKGYYKMDDAGNPLYGYNTIVYPGWVVISEENGNLDKADVPGRHYEYGWWEVLDDENKTRRENLTVRGLSYYELEHLADNKDGFLSFGLFEGKFYSAKAVNTMQPNKAFFRIHTSKLHENHKKYFETNSAAAKDGVMIIDENDYDNTATAIKTINNPQSTVKDGDWYTLDGMRLNTAPTQKGIYIRNGKKVVIK